MEQLRGSVDPVFEQQIRPPRVRIGTGAQHQRNVGHGHTLDRVVDRLARGADHPGIDGEHGQCGRTGQGNQRLDDTDDHGLLAVDRPYPKRAPLIARPHSAKRAVTAH